MWSRAFGVALSLLALLPVFAMARALTGSDTLALGAMLLTAVSPALAADAAKVGVDTPLAAIGGLAVMLAGAGILALAARRDPRAVTVLLFPLGFFALMAAQKVNFTRNVLVLIPVIAVLAAVAVAVAAPRARRLALALLLITAVQPAVQAVRASRPLPPDSRLLAGQWLGRGAGPRSETVVTTEVGWPRSGPGGRNITMADTETIDPLALYVQGFDRLITRGAFPAGEAGGVLREEHVVAGATGDMLILVSPEVRIYRLGEPLGTAAAAWRSADLCAGRSAAEWFAVEVDLRAAELRREGALTVRVQEVHGRAVGRGRTIRVGLAVRDVALLR